MEVWEEGQSDYLHEYLLRSSVVTPVRPYAIKLAKLIILNE